jgi:hypothetical protein
MVVGDQNPFHASRSVVDADPPEETVIEFNRRGKPNPAADLSGVMKGAA